MGGLTTTIAKQFLGHDRAALTCPDPLSQASIHFNLPTTVLFSLSMTACLYSKLSSPEHPFNRILGTP